MSSVCHLHVLVCYAYVTRITRMSSVCHSYVLVCHSCVTRMYSMLSVCHSYVLVCHPYVPRMHLYVIRMSLVCTPMSSVCHSYVFVCHPYVTHMWFYHEPCHTLKEKNVKKAYQNVKSVAISQKTNCYKKKKLRKTQDFNRNN